MQDVRLSKLSKLLQLERSEYEQAAEATASELEALRAECWALRRGQVMSSFNSKAMQDFQHKNYQECGEKKKKEKIWKGESGVLIPFHLVLRIFFGVFILLGPFSFLPLSCAPFSYFHFPLHRHHPFLLIKKPLPKSIQLLSEILELNSTIASLEQQLQTANRDLVAGLVDGMMGTVAARLDNLASSSFATAMTNDSSSSSSISKDSKEDEVSESFIRSNLDGWEAQRKSSDGSRRLSFGQRVVAALENLAKAAAAGGDCEQQEEEMVEEVEEQFVCSKGFFAATDVSEQAEDDLAQANTSMQQHHNAVITISSVGASPMNVAVNVSSPPPLSEHATTDTSTFECGTAMSPMPQAFECGTATTPTKVFECGTATTPAAAQFECGTAMSPCQASERGTEMSPTKFFECGTATTPAPAALSVSMATDLTMATLMERLRTPPAMHAVGQMTSPLSPVVQFMSLAVNNSPTELLQQIESVSISNELLRDTARSLQKELSEKEAALASIQLQMQGMSSLSKEETNALKQQLQQHSSLVDQLQGEIEQLQSEREMLQLAVSQSSFARSEESEQIQTREQELMQVIAEKTQQLQQMESDMSALRSHAAQARQEMDSLRADYDSKLAAQTSAAKNLQEDLRRIYHKHKKELADLQAEYKHDAYKERYAEVVQENSMLVARVSKMMSLVQQVEDMSRLQEQATAGLDMAAAALEKQAAEMEESKAQWQHREEELQATIESMRVTMAEIYAKVEDGEAVTAELRNALATAQDAIVRLSSNEELLQTELQLAQSDAMVAASAKAEVDQMQARIQQLEGTVASLETEIQVLEAALAERAAEAAEHDIKLQELTQAREEAEQQLQQLQSMGESDRVALQTEVDRLMNMQMDAEAAARMATTKMVECAEQLEEKSRQYNELKDFIEEERTIRQEVIDDMERELEDAHRKLQSMQEVGWCMFECGCRNEGFCFHSLTMMTTMMNSIDNKR